MTNRFEKHPKLTLAFVLLFFLLLIELLVRFAAGLDLVRVETHRTTAKPKFWNDINKDFGVWHYANKTFNHKSSCFDLTLRTNSYGARDSERGKKHQGRRFVVLGDSFTEGYGVSAKDRFTNLLEKKTGLEFLNFGTAGQFGTVQQYIQYQTMVSHFQHTDVALFFLPANDFTDVDPGFFDNSRYRPYLLKDKNNQLQLSYLGEFNPNKHSKDLPAGKVVLNTLSNYWWTYNVIRKAIRQIKHRENNKKYDKPAGLGYYDHYNEQQAEVVMESLKRLVKHAEGKKIWLFVIPTHSDFQAYFSQSLKGRVVEMLQKFAQAHENVWVVDLLPYFLEQMKEELLGKNYHTYFLTCDDHWSPKGHKLVAEVVKKVIDSK